MKLVVRAITKTGAELQEGVVEAIGRVLQPTEIQILSWVGYWKMPDRKEILLEMQIREGSLDVLVESIGSHPVWRSDTEVIFDTWQGSVIGIGTIDWLHLEVAE